MSVDDFDELDEQMEQRIEEYVGMLQRNASVVDALRAENAKLRAQNHSFISAGQKQDIREHELAMDRRALAMTLRQAYSGFGYCKLCHAHGLHPHDPSCPVALAERVLAEPVTQLCPTTADNAPDVAQDGAHG